MRKLLIFLKITLLLVLICGIAIISLWYSRKKTEDSLLNSSDSYSSNDIKNFKIIKERIPHYKKKDFDNDLKIYAEIFGNRENNRENNFTKKIFEIQNNSVDFRNLMTNFQLESGKMQPYALSTFTNEFGEIYIPDTLYKLQLLETDSISQDFIKTKIFGVYKIFLDSSEKDETEIGKIKRILEREFKKTELEIKNEEQLRFFIDMQVCFSNIDKLIINYVPGKGERYPEDIKDLKYVESFDFSSLDFQGRNPFENIKFPCRVTLLTAKNIKNINVFTTFPLENIEILRLHYYDWQQVTEIDEHNVSNILLLDLFHATNLKFEDFESFGKLRKLHFSNFTNMENCSYVNSIANHLKKIKNPHFVIAVYNGTDKFKQIFKENNLDFYLNNK